MKLRILNNVAAREFRYVKWTVPLFLFFLQLFLQVPKGKTKMFSRVVICTVFKASRLHIQG